MKIRLLLLLTLSLSPVGEALSALDAPARAQVLLNNWKNADVTILANPENAGVLAELQKIAFSSTNVRARVILLNFGDPSFVTWWLSQIASANSQERQAALSLTHRVRNPALILALEPLLLRQESADDIVIDGDYVTKPSSVTAALVIVNIINNSVDFPNEVKSWSRSFTSNDALRTALRKWISENGELLKAGEFGGLKPLN